MTADRRKGPGLAYVHFRPEFCKGCAYCVKICPKDVYAMSATYNALGYAVPAIVRPEACIACLRCETMCPDLALYIEPR